MLVAQSALLRAKDKPEETSHTLRLWVALGPPEKQRSGQDAIFQVHLSQDEWSEVPSSDIWTLQTPQAREAGSSVLLHFTNATFSRTSQTSLDEEETEAGPHFCTEASRVDTTAHATWVLTSGAHIQEAVKSDPGERTPQSKSTQPRQR